MARIVLLALGAAVFPTLLACVAIMISRPEPRSLLLAFYAGGMIASVTAGIVVLALFNKGNAVLGNTSSKPSPGTSIVLGLLAVLFAWLMASARGNALLHRWRSRHPPRHKVAKDQPSWAERHLGGANAAVAFAVGAPINLPGPFYVLALGDIATGDYTSLESFGLILVFNVIMFTLLEVPLVGYRVRPERTAEQVARVATWLNANALRVMGWLIGAAGAGLIVQGIVAAV
jgi:hypothetical protein